MFIRDNVWLAIHNLMAQKKIAIKILAGLTMSIAMIISLYLYLSSFQNEMESYNFNHKTECYFFTEYNQGYSVKNFLKILDEGRSQKEELHAGEMSIYARVNRKEEKTDKIKNMAMKIGDRKYTGKPSWSSSNKDIKGMEAEDFLVGLYNKECSIFPNSVMEKYKKETGKQRCYIGNLPQNQGEVFISDYMLERFGISANDQEKIIGKSITIYIKDSDNEEYCKDYILSGIFDSRILDIRETNIESLHLEQILINYLPSDYSKVNVTSSCLYYYFDSYEKLNENMKNSGYEENILRISSRAEMFQIMDSQIQIVNYILKIIGFGYIVAITMYLFCMILLWLRKNQAYFMMLRAIGVRNIQICGIYLLQVLMIGIVAIIIGGYFSIILLLGIFNKYQLLFDYKLLISWEMIVKALLLTGGYIFGVILLIGVYYGRQLYTKEIVPVLKRHK